ncbi:MAG: hypothetical protein SCALA702_00400 [Melioribacteraceae bacterium]|nr:MAG: hypothetical protein SCALA702_00400 [Melioribacteraceae bacterium]
MVKHNEVIRSSKKKIAAEKDEARIQYFLDKMFAQTNLYWKRANILLLINAAVIGVVSKMITDPTPWSDQSRIFYLGVSVIGLILSVLWLFMQSVSKYNEDKYKYDAQRILFSKGNEKLREVYSTSMDIISNHKSIENQNQIIHKPKNILRFSASMFMNIIVSVFVLIWLIFLTHSIINILNAA